MNQFSIFATNRWRWSIFVALVFCSGCLGSSSNEVVVYSALDKEFSQPILEDLETEMGWRILTKFDQESNKTVGLVADIMQNPRRARADLFWNNEILHAIRLENLGLLEVYESPEAANFPSQFVSRQKSWYGFAARARVLLVNTELIPNPDDYPKSIFDLANPKWKGKCAMGRPVFGTSATHAAILFHRLGDKQARKWMTEFASNAIVEGGNKQVAIKVGRGQYAFGITDTDDAIIEIEQAKPVVIVFPDQGENQMGTLLIPNTLCLIKNGPNPERAKQLLDRLLKPDIETRLAQGRSAQIPLNKNIAIRSRVEIPEWKIMDADFEAASEHWEETAAALMQIFPVGGK